MTEAQAKAYRVNPFDLTKVWSHKDFPLIEVGELELNRNVENYFAEVEQVALSPSNFVPGIGASPDKMLQARLLAYPDAQRYRLSANYNHLPVNLPRCPVQHYQRDGKMAGTLLEERNNNQHDQVNFYPNDQRELGAPVPDSNFQEPPLPLEEVWVKAYDTQAEDNFTQAGDLFRLMSDSQKDQLAQNIAGGLCQASDSIQARMLEQFAAADPDYAKRVKQYL